MEEKEQDSLTISDILDQLVKPPITQSPGVPPRPVSQPSTTLPPIKTGATDIKLPQLGKVGGEESVFPKNYQSQPAELRLSVRTMADDLEKMKRGQKPSASPEIQKITSSSAPPPPKSQPRPTVSLPPRPVPMPSRPPPIVIPSRPPIPPPPSKITASPVRPMPLPPISAPPSATEPKHYHPEKVLTEEEFLPPFLGAPIPKKVKKPTKEKVQYGLIAKIIGSGMTTGIIITLILAAIAYGLLYFFYLKGVEAPIASPTPTPIGATSTPLINELETIFRAVAVLNFQLPSQKQETLSSLKSFINNQILSKKEFKRLNIALLPGQGQTILSFTDLMSNLSLNYPSELKNEINNNYLVLLYGQEELFIEPAGSTPKKLVFITEIKDVIKMSEIMRNWEQTLSEDLKDLLDIDPSKKASPTFLDNDRRGVKIRYKNFSLPDQSIDYTILSSLTNHHYLIITNSRESMYSPTDKLRGL